MECKCKYVGQIDGNAQNELIDTLWNVNLKSCRQPDSVLGINRYIMECKYKFTFRTVMTVTELIDTLWNVNKRGRRRGSRKAFTN